jgi:protein-disulfide isomerase
MASMLKSRGLLAGALGVALGAGAMAAWSAGSGGSDKAEVETIVRDYVLANPEIIPEAMARLQEREAAKVVLANRAAFETPFGGAWAGAENGDVVLVEFFDYACGFCRKSNADVERLLKEDPKLKVVWRDWPVLGPESERAAEVSLAAASKGRFRPFYDTLFGLGRPSAETIAQAQRAAGLSDADVAAVAGSAAARAELGKNDQLARALNASGTPTFIVGGQVLQGALGYDALKEAIEQARSTA